MDAAQICSFAGRLDFSASQSVVLHRASDRVEASREVASRGHLRDQVRTRESLTNYVARLVPAIQRHPNGLTEGLGERLIPGSARINFLPSQVLIYRPHGGPAVPFQLFLNSLICWIGPAETVQCRDARGKVGVPRG